MLITGTKSLEDITDIFVIWGVVGESPRNRGSEGVVFENDVGIDEK